MYSCNNVQLSNMTTLIAMHIDIVAYSMFADRHRYRTMKDTMQQERLYMS